MKLADLMNYTAVPATRLEPMMKTQNPLILVQAIWLGLLMGLSGCGQGGGKHGGQTEAKAKAMLSAKLEGIRQAGQPVTLAELKAWYPEPPAGENAAPLYAEAFAALAAAEAKSPSFLAKNEAALALLHKAAAKRQCRYPIDLGEAFVKAPHLGKLKTCAQLLGREAVASAGKGRADLAAQFLSDGLGLGRSLEQEPLLISQLVRMACDSITQTSLEEALSLRAFPEEQLVSLQAALREEERTVEPSLARAFATERWSLVRLFQMPPREYEELIRSAGANCPLPPPAELEAYRQSAAFNADLNLCLDQFSNWIAVASAPFPAALEAAGQWAPEAAAQAGEAKTKGCRIFALMSPAALNHGLEGAADCVGQLRAAEAGLAVERYRLASSYALPDSLSQVVPKYLTAVPDDPYDGKPLRYKKLSPKGYVVYSIGRNRLDDGGTPRPGGGKADGPYDVTFAVRR